MRKFILLFIFSISPFVLAVEDDCGDQSMNIVQMRVIAPSDSQNNTFQDSLLLKFDKPCRGKYYAYIARENPAFKGILSMALAAYMSKTPVYPAVVTSETRSSGVLAAERILWLRFDR